jgi:hypothetical protein
METIEYTSRIHRLLICYSFDESIDEPKKRLDGDCNLIDDTY